MATINPTYETFATARFSSNLIRVTWANVTEADSCAVAECGDFADRSVHFSGSFGGATGKLQGSNDGATFLDLTDPQGNAISKTGPAIEAVMELTYQVKPVFSGGAAQNVTVSMIGRRQPR